MSVCEYVHNKGSFRVTTVNGQITGHGLDIGVVDDPINGRAEASSKTVTGSKEVRAEPYAAQVQGGNVALLAGTWNADFLDEHEVSTVPLRDR
jgi:phage terminase large subunit-like protein